MNASRSPIVEPGWGIVEVDYGGIFCSSSKQNKEEKRTLSVI
jgi:hypothetical protein